MVLFLVQSMQPIYSRETCCLICYVIIPVFGDTQCPLVFRLMIFEVQNNKQLFFPLHNLWFQRKYRRKLSSRLRKPAGHIAGRKQQRSEKFTRCKAHLYRTSRAFRTRFLPWNRMTIPYRLEGWSYTGTLPLGYFCCQSLTWWRFCLVAAHRVVACDRTPTKPPHYHVLVLARTMLRMIMNF